MSYLLTLPYPVSANRYWRSLSRRGRVIVSKEALAYRDAVHKTAMASGIRKPLPGLVGVSVALYPKLPKNWVKLAARDPRWYDSVRCMDLDNCLKVVLDSLLGIAYTDDALVRKIEAIREIPDGDSRVVVNIWPMS